MGSTTTNNMQDSMQLREVVRYYRPHLYYRFTCLLFLALFFFLLQFTFSSLFFFLPLDSVDIVCFERE